MQQFLIILILVLFILSLTSQLEELKKNPSEFIKKKIIEFFTASIKDKQKIGSSYNDKDNIMPKGTFKIGNINAERCYSTDTRSGNKTKRINTYYCDQGIDGSEVIPYTDLSTVDFNNYNIHYGKIAKGTPLTGIFNNNGISITLDKNGKVSNTLLSVNESKLFCDSMGDKCYGFITIIPTKTNNNNNATFFLKNTLEGWEDPDTYIKINVIGQNMKNNETNTNYISYIKKNVKYVEKPIDDKKLKSTSDKYINLATCNWKSGNRCIFRDYVYNQTKDSCASADGLTYNVPGINSYTQQELNDWLTTLYKRDLGANKLTSEAVNVNEYIQRCKEVNDFEFLAGISLPNPYIPTTKPGDVKGRYIRITTNNVALHDAWLNFAEVQVISNNRNIAVGKPSSASSSTTNPSKGNDGNSNSDVINNNLNNSSVFLSGNDGGPQYWEVDLGDASQTIDRVIVAKGSTTPSWGQQILSNWLLSIYDYNKKLIWARIFKEPPNPKAFIDILNANNDINNIRVNDYSQSRFNKYFQRVSNTEYSTKRGWSGDCPEQCHREICEGERKKWIGNSNYGCREYRPGEYEAELAEKARLEEERKRGFNESDFLNSGHKAILLSWLPPNSKTTLIYKGSRDGMSAGDFHRKVNGKGANITILKNSHGHTIGGYSSLDWGSAGCYANDSNAFLFSLDTNRKFKASAWHSLCAHQPYGPTFGGGHDLMIFGWDYNGNNCYHNPNSFNYEGGKLTKSHHDSGGFYQNMFKVIWIETYQVTPR